MTVYKNGDDDNDYVKLYKLCVFSINKISDVVSSHPLPVIIIIILHPFSPPLSINFLDPHFISLVTCVYMQYTLLYSYFYTI